MLKNKILSSVSGQEEKLYVDDVFSAWLRTGTGADVTVTTGIDMAKGYGLWTKGRSGATDHALYHSARGVTLDLATNTTAAQTTQATGLKSVSATGHTVGSLAKMNTSGATYVDWVFRNADKFYNHAVVIKSAGSNATVSFSNLNTLGMVRVKRTDSTGSWYIWHRSLSAGQLLIGETTAAAATLGHVTVSGTTVTLVNGVIADGTYLVEAFAHDSSADGIIQCGSFTTDGSGNATVNLGWEPQWATIKASNSTGLWITQDAMRGLVASDTVGARLYPNASYAEDTNASIRSLATGFATTSAGVGASQAYIYLAIRRPNKPPKTGTEVYNAIARTGTGADVTITGLGLTPDLNVVRERNVAGYGHTFFDRLRGGGMVVESTNTNAEPSPGALGTVGFAVQDGVTQTTGIRINNSGFNYINHFFRRAPGFMDEVCDTGTSVVHTVSHNLAVEPELVIRKSRSAATQWEVWHSALAATEKLVLNSAAAKTTDVTAWNSTAPTAMQFTVGTGANVNANNATFVTYLFATLAGISKVGSYIGNGTTQTINCGFTTGARFVLIKATSTTGNWIVADTSRGILSSADPALYLNSTAAEVTGVDWVDPNIVGFDIIQEGTMNANVNGVSYIYFSVA